jgi:hypothetical protein
MADRTGCTGDQGDLVIELDTDAPIFTPPRRKSPADVDVRNEKCRKLADEGHSKKQEREVRHGDYQPVCPTECMRPVPQV